MLRDYSFSPYLACQFGVNEAIMTHNILFWIQKNKVDGRNKFDGHTWTYNTVKAFSKVFPFWSEQKITRILKSLVDQKVLITGNYNKSPYNRTKWYAFKDESILDMNPDLSSLKNGGNSGSSPKTFEVSDGKGSICQTRKMYKTDRNPYSNPNKKLVSKETIDSGFADAKPSQGKEIKNFGSRDYDNHLESNYDNHLESNYDNHLESNYDNIKSLEQQFDGNVDYKYKTNKSLEQQCEGNSVVNNNMSNDIDTNNAKNLLEKPQVERSDVNEGKGMPEQKKPKLSEILKSGGRVRKPIEKDQPVDRVAAGDTASEAKKKGPSRGVRRPKTKNLKSKNVTDTLPETSQMSSKNNKSIDQELTDLTVRHLEHWNEKVKGSGIKDKLLKTHKIDTTTKTFAHIRNSIDALIDQNISFPTIRIVIDSYFLAIKNMPPQTVAKYVGFKDFLNFSNFLERQIAGHKKNTPLKGQSSWFDFILSTMKENKTRKRDEIAKLISDKFVMKIKDPHPDVTFEFRYAYAEHTGLKTAGFNVREQTFSPSVESILVRAGSKFVEFADRLKLKPQSTMRTVKGYIHTMFELKNFGDLTLKEHPEYILSNNFWNHEFESLLKKYNYL